MRIAVKYFALVYSTFTGAILLCSAWLVGWPECVGCLLVSALLVAVIACLLKPRKWLKPLVLLMCGIGLCAFFMMSHSAHWLGLLAAAWFLLGPVCILLAVFLLRRPEPVTEAGPQGTAPPTRDR